MAREINAGDWNEVVSGADRPVIVDYWHEQCPWCLKLSPIYEELSEENDEAIFIKLNVRANDENMSLAQSQGIMSTPTIKIFCDGREVGETVGFTDKDNLKKEIDRLISSSDSCLSSSSPNV